MGRKASDPPLPSKSGRKKERKGRWRREEEEEKQKGINACVCEGWGGVGDSLVKTAPFPGRSASGVAFLPAVFIFGKKRLLLWTVAVGSAIAATSLSPPPPHAAVPTRECSGGLGGGCVCEGGEAERAR